jgi:hypothetical protein
VITEKQLTEWEKLLDESTKGPWKSYGEWNTDTEELNKASLQSRCIPSEMPNLFVCNTAGVDDSQVGSIILNNPRDLKLIAESRTAMPALIAEVRALRKVAEAANKARHNSYATMHDCIPLNEALEALAEWREAHG